MKTLVLNFIFLVYTITLVSTQVSEQKWYTVEEKNKTYYIEEEYKYSWYEAFLECSARNLSLLTIETLEEHEDIAKILREGNFRFHGPHLWVGAAGWNRQFVWVANSQPVFTDKWISGNPDNFNLEEHCLLFCETTTDLNDRKCEYHHGFICEENEYDTPNGDSKEINNKIILNIIHNG